MGRSPYRTSPPPRHVVYELHVARWPDCRRDPIRTFRRRWVARLVGWFIASTGHAGVAEVPPEVVIIPHVVSSDSIR